MGYETKMFIGMPYRIGEETYVQIDGHNSAYRVFNDNNKKGSFFYLQDGSIKRYISGLKRQQINHKIVVGVQIMQVVAMVDLCKASYGEVGDVIRKGHNKDGVKGGFYDDSGNSVIIEDRYGDCMSFVDPKEVLVAMQEEQNKTKESYRRFVVAIATLQAAIEGFPSESLKVLFFGY